jgi:hypothetical protein
MHLGLVAADSWRGPIAPRRLLTLLLIPAAATAVYSVAFALDLRPPTGVLIYLIVTPLGFVLLARSLLRVWRRPPAVTPQSSG